MKFSHFRNNIKKLTRQPVGGLNAQFKLAPKIRLKYSEKMIALENPKKAAVLVMFYPNKKGDTNFLLTLRSDYNGTHSAQISFPGGKFEPSDNSLEHTALRETNEEVGILKKDISIFKKMTDVYIPPSNFLVTPFLGILSSVPTFITNHEVAKIINVCLSEFLDDSAISSTVLTTSYAENMVVPCFKLNNYMVWGATAMMLSEIKDLFENI
jgi:8-oxo-dGTP pyrophosphatase MutT (NUDIX family)